jgi:hypothetical protein
MESTLVRFALEALLLLISVLLGGISKILWDRVKSMEADIKAVVEENNKIRTNYVNRFDDVKETMNKQFAIVIQNINDLRLHMSENFMRREDCRVQHFIKEANQ